MASIKRAPDKPYCIGARIQKISVETRRKFVRARLENCFDDNRLGRVLHDRVDDITFTEAKLIADILGCTMEQLYDRGFDFNQIRQAA
ncbi:MAG: hypothetical protein AAFY71_07915 [Bacteroidota bacterium]